MLWGAPRGVAQTANVGTTPSSNTLEKFKKPDVDAKGMFRWWFPDAGASEALVQEQVRSIYDAGFGGVEVAMVPHWTDFDAAQYGWGTAPWINIMKSVLRAAKVLPGPFKVDFTITAHWPPSINTIDPNNIAASEELSFAYRKITSPESGAPLPMPERKTSDQDGKQAADFFFTDTFVAATIAKVAAVKDNIVTLDYGSMRDLTAKVSTILDPSTGQPKFTPAGIPENSTLFGNKTKLQDKQYYQQVDLASAGLDGGYISSAGEGVAPGDWLLFGFYYRGTGQILNGTTMMHLTYPMANRMYVVDYYSRAGIDAVIDYWNKNFLSDPELKDLLLWAHGDIFEDSIESSSRGAFWTHDLLDQFKKYRNYDLTGYLPLVASIRGSPTIFRSSTGNQLRIQHDYSDTLADLYIDAHVKEIEKWTKTFGNGYRAQSYGGSIDTSGAATLLDVAEGESLGFGTRYDNFRNIAGGVHAVGKKYLSDEALADVGKSYALTWKSVCDTLNNNYAAGVNRVVIHGTAYEKEMSGKYSAWPGWHAFQNAFAEPWGDRQPYWQDVPLMSGFIARNQVVLQNGQPQMDVVIYKTIQNYGRGFPELLDNGYSYDIFSTPSLFLPGSVVKDKVLIPTGPSYRAMILNNQRTISVPAADKLVEYAQSGLPIIFYGQVPSRVHGVSGEMVTALSGRKDTDTDVVARMNALLSLPSVRRVSTTEALLSALAELGVRPSAEYRQPGVRTLRRLDSDGTNYYFVFNSSQAPIDLAATFEGKGKPYHLDTWSGDVTPIIQYTESSGKISTQLKLGAGESTVIAVSPSNAFGVVPNYYVSKSDGDVLDVDGKLVVRGEKPETVHSMLSDNTAKVTEIAKVGEKIPLEKWNLQIESWGPGDNHERPTIAKKTLIAVGEISLNTWNHLAAPAAALEAAGVKSLAEVSGIATYSTQVILPGRWTGGYGAYLQFKHGDDMVTQIIVNGRTISGIDQSQGLVDLGKYLKGGANQTRIKLVTTLNDRLKVENELFGPNAPRFGPPPGARRPGGGPPGAPGPGGGPPGGFGPGGPVNGGEIDEDEGGEGGFPPMGGRGNPRDRNTG